jgi:MGT family glycosyltransferase
MTHFGLICPQSTGHLNPMVSLGLALMNNGHHVTLFCVEDVQQKFSHSALNLEVIGRREIPLGTVPKFLRDLGNPQRSLVEQVNQDVFSVFCKVVLKEVPDITRSLGIDVLLVDQLCPEGGTIAEYLGIPFISICTILPLNYELLIPPCFTNWSYRTDTLAKLRNHLGYFLFYLVRRPVFRIIAEFRSRWGLPPLKHPDEAFSPLAQICPLPPRFEFPRRHLPQQFVFTGPWINEASHPTVPFPFEQLDGRPIIYVSFGTIFNQNKVLFQRIATAVKNLDAQTIITLGNSLSVSDFWDYPKNILFVDYAPQYELLQQASLTIAHAGMNTTLDSLYFGVPMVALPISGDQHGVAARIAWTQTGETLAPRKRSVKHLQSTIKRVLNNPVYRHNVLGIQSDMKQAGGLRKAVEVIEGCI